MTRILDGILLFVALALAAAIPGCAMETDDPVGSSSGLGLWDIGFEVDGIIKEQVWRMAPEGCEGRLEGEDIERVAYAEGAPDLGVVISVDGEPVCVDELDQIIEEMWELEGDPSPDPMYPKERPDDFMRGDD